MKNIIFLRTYSPFSFLLFLFFIFSCSLFACHHALGLNTNHSVPGSFHHHQQRLADIVKQSRQYSSATYPSNHAASASMYTSPIEAIVVGVLAVCGLSLFGIPLLLMLFNLYNLNSNPGVSLIPTATTSVNTGRRKRNAPTNPFLDQNLVSKVLKSLNSFMDSEHKMDLLQQIIS